MHISTIRPILDEVRSAGQMAYRAQQEGRLERGFKSDGSVITQIDTQVEEALHARISALFPTANILTEESVRTFDESRAYTFVIDPIDGTDGFSLGMPGWCVSVGLMRDFLPVAGILYSPPMDLLLFADLGQRVARNDQAFSVVPGPAEITPKTNIVVSSSIHQQVELKRYPGKFRSVGSAALQLCYPLIYPGIYATLESCSTHIWDILAAHAICLSIGMVVEWLAGGAVRYAGLIDGRSIGAPILSGPSANVAGLRSLLLDGPGTPAGG